MIGLNIASYNENTGREGTWQELSAPEKAAAVTAPIEELVMGKGSVQNPDLFDLARSISSRAYSRRHTRRSSAII